MTYFSIYTHTVNTSCCRQYNESRDAASSESRVYSYSTDVYARYDLPPPLADTLIVSMSACHRNAYATSFVTSMFGM